MQKAKHLSKMLDKKHSFDALPDPRVSCVQFDESSFWDIRLRYVFAFPILKPVVSISDKHG